MSVFDKALALQLGNAAVDYLRETDPEVFKWAIETSRANFEEMELQTFLRAYCWVVYASGFRFSTVKALFPRIASGFKNFDPDAIARMRSIKPVLEVFNNERKARCFLTGAKQVVEEGFDSFKTRLGTRGPDVLLELGGIGPITKNHLAKNIGLADVAKADIWLVRAAQLCGASSVDHFIVFLTSELRLSAHAIDVAIWTYAKDGEMSRIAKKKKDVKK